MEAKTPQRLAELFHHRWAVPIMAQLHRESGSKFVTLANRLQISRDSLTKTLSALIETRQIMRNPGHGHPLRPEYILTPSGERLGTWCLRVCRTLKRLDIESMGLRKWSLPVTYALRLGKTRFSKLRIILPTLTPRALTLTLKHLQNAGIVTRRVQDGYPPTTCYALTAKGNRLAAILDGH